VDIEDLEIAYQAEYEDIQNAILALGRIEC
jgi:hypothetical protein